MVLAITTYRERGKTSMRGITCAAPRYFLMFNLIIDSLRPGSAMSFSMAAISIGTNAERFSYARLSDQNHVLEADAETFVFDLHRRFDCENPAGFERRRLQSADVVYFHADGVAEAAAVVRPR